MDPVTSFVIRYERKSDRHGIYYLNGEAKDTDSNDVMYRLRHLSGLRNPPPCMQIRMACNIARTTGARVLFSQDRNWEPVRV